jgi:DNA-directed RNA polymerase beta subunit
MQHFPFCTEDDHFSLIEKFFVEKGSVVHQFESYEHMVYHTIQKIFDECTSISIETKTTLYKATFGQVYFEKASVTDENRVLKYITPNEARLRDLTYDSPVFVDIKEEFWEKGEKVNQLNHPKVFIFRMPTMVRSSRCNLYGLSIKECMEQGECENDCGGYFIINGKERALICQERLNYNQVYLFESNSDKYSHIAEIRSMSEETCHSVLLKAVIDKDFRNCCFSLPYMSKEVLAGTVFKALGFTNEEIFKLIHPYSIEEIKLTERLIRESMIYNTKDKAIKYISKSSIQKVEDSEERRINYTIQVIENELFPHMGISTNLEKGILLGTMINKLFRVCLGKRNNEDRDNVSIKRIEGPGVLLSDLFRMCLKRYCDNLKKYLEKRQDIITAISRTNSITTAIKSPMCFVKGTLVSLSNGTSLPIESLQDIGNNVLGWNKDTGLLKPSIQTHFFNQGERETIILTFEDGRTIQCTPDHKLLNEKSTWIEACSIPNGSQVFCHDKELSLKLIKLVDIRPGNTQTVYDITVEDTHSFLANGIVSSNCTGNWTAQKNTYVRTGVSQIMSRLTYPATISHLRRIVIPIGKEGKNVKISQVHPTQCFFVDIIESPEGKGIGIIKNFSLLAKLTVGCNSILVRKLVEECKYFQLTQTYFETKDPIMIYLNGTLIGITKNSDEYYKQLKILKFDQHILSDQVSFTMDKDEHEIRIFCDHGRFMRPLLTIENNKLLLTKKDLVKKWSSLLEDDIIRYIDSNEVENSLIAMYPSDVIEYHNQTYNYCEIHPSTMLGVCSAVIPYGEHNQCIFKNEPVYLADGTTKPICDIIVGDEVITFDPDTQKQTTAIVSHTYANKTNKKMYELTSINGRCIKATYDHQFMTSEGWKRVEDIIENETLVGISMEPKAVSNTNISVLIYYEYMKYIEFNKNLVKFDEWKQRVIIKESTIFMPIMSKKISLENEICDITIDSPNQSFICGDHFCVHNCPRLVYEASMLKQALGVYALSYKNRFDTISHVMQYPQKPLVETKYNKMLHYDEMLTGFNPIVAVSCYTGFNQEDSLLINKSSVERGMFVTTAYRTLVYEEKKKTNCSFEKIEIPPLKSQNKTMNYSKLGPDGIVKKGLPVYKGDIIVGKTLTKVQKEEKEEKMDCSLSISSGEEGIIDEIWTDINEEGYFMVKIKIRQLRIPEVGDKFASRSSQKGVCGLLLEQENMPFTSQGITPDLIMNPHCFTKETLVTLCNGLSKRISDMSVSGGEDVWCHDKKSGITMSKNLSMGCGGVKPIVKLTFEDGRTIRCTHGHQFYTSDGKWIEAQNIELGKDKIQMSLEGVFDEIGEDENVDWLFFNDREKTLAFARILGYTLSDGCICKSNGSFSCPVSFGSIIDAELCKQDILLLTGKSPKILTNNSSIGAGNVYIINLPCELVKLIVNLDGITIGRRTQQETTWPSFLFTSPKSVIREFLAGLFGGDGHAPYLTREHVQEIRFSQTTTRKYEDHFTQKMQSLCDLLNLFHVDACIERKRYYHKSTYKECSLEDIKEDEDYMTTIYIIVKDSLAFTQNIGMRYCIEKMSRLSLYKSYKLLQKRVKKQSEDIFALVDFYNKKGSTLQKSLSIAREEYFKTNISLNEYYTFGISGKTQLGNRRKENRSSDVLHLNYKYFPTFKKYIENLGCLHWYSNKEYAIDREASVLPTFNMKVVGRVDDGEEPIYCFNVKDFNNFIAEGTVVSNSIPSRMTLSQLIECLYSKVGSLDGTFGDSTAFTEQSINPVEDIAKKLKSYGFQRYGNERMYNGFTGEMMDSEIFIGPTYYQRLKHLVADKIHCLTPDHDVLTISGWKKILDITLKDKVATLNKNGELEYDNPLNIMNYPDYEGSMYYIKNQSIDLAVTGNHRMWVSKRYGRKREWLSYDFERADQLLGKIVKYKKDAEWIKDDYQFIIPSVVKYVTKYVNITMPDKIVDMNSWLVFWGIWIAEGWTSGTYSSGRVTISINKQRVKDALYPSLDKLNIEYKIEEKSEKLNIYDNQLYIYMKTFSVGAPVKKLPEWVFNLSKKQTRLLLESMILGDGSIAKNGCKFYYTSSKCLADQFQQLCLHAGWASILSTHIKANNNVIINGRSVTSNFDVLRLSIITKRLNPTVNHGHVKTQNVQKEIFIENQNCHVVCLEVPNQIFYVRRNGKAVWTGNSRATGNVTMMHHQPSEGRSREGGLRVGEMERDALISHGGAAFIQETLFDMSDEYQVNVCETCGNILSTPTGCRICKNGLVNRTNIPYCAKLLFQELEAMGIKIQIHTK